MSSDALFRMSFTPWDETQSEVSYQNHPKDAMDFSKDSDWLHFKSEWWTPIDARICFSKRKENMIHYHQGSIIAQKMLNAQKLFFSKGSERPLL